VSPGAPSPRRARLPPSRRFFSPAASVHVPRPLGGQGSRRAADSFLPRHPSTCPALGRARLPPSRRFFSPAASVHVPRPLGGRGSRRAAHSPRRSSRPLSCVIAIFLPLGLSVDRAGGAAVVWMAVVVRLGRSLALPRVCPARQEPRPPEGLSGSAGASPSRGFAARQEPRPTGLRGEVSGEPQRNNGRIFVQKISTLRPA
jgi:hypothetical protein